MLKIILPAAVLLSVAAAGQGAPSLAGSEWDLAERDTPFVRFETGGNLAGHGGCNRFFGGYEENGRELKIGPLGATRKACPGTIMEKEAAFLSRLQEAKSAVRSDGKLELFDGKGGLLIVLRQRDWD